MHTSYPIAALDGMSPEYERLLKAEGIRTTARLLDAACGVRGRKALAAKTGIPERLLLRWANMADRMRIKGIGQDTARLLEAAGVVTVRELGYRNPANLARSMAEANAKRKLVRALPTEKAIGRWIEMARKLDQKIKY
jgi:predicted flap endonuclease-1-like 5' DNA nuclease